MSATTSPDDHDRVTALLGRPPAGPYEVVVRTPGGDPVVLRNAPLLDDGRPMPTRYWLVGERAVLAVSRLEAAGGVRAAEAAIDAAAIVAAHDRYAAERDAAIPPTATHRPSGGVGGTRTGVKCLHAHYAWYLAGGDDPVGRWVAEQLGARLTLVVAHDRVTIHHDADTIALGTGPGQLADGELADRDPPSPAALTNALGAVIDEVDEAVRVHPALAAAHRLTIGGDEAWHLAQVERGRSDLGAAEVIGRDDIEDLFRTIATERRADRRHNPALDPARVDTIIATCCVVLGVMRHLHLPDATFVADPGTSAATHRPGSVPARAGC